MVETVRKLSYDELVTFMEVLTQYGNEINTNRRRAIGQKLTETISEPVTGDDSHGNK